MIEPTGAVVKQEDSLGHSPSGSKRCSTCGKHKPHDNFDGRATCNDCRFRKRKFAEQATVSRKENLSKLEHENEHLRTTIIQQARQLTDAKRWQAEAHRLSMLAVQQQMKLQQMRGNIFGNQQMPQGSFPHTATGQQAAMGAMQSGLSGRISDIGSQHQVPAGMQPQDNLEGLSPQERSSRRISSSSCIMDNSMNTRHTDLTWAGAHTSCIEDPNTFPERQVKRQKTEQQRSGMMEPSFVPSSEYAVNNSLEMASLLDLTFESIVFPDSCSGPSVGAGSGSGGPSVGAGGGSGAACGDIDLEDSLSSCEETDISPDQLPFCVLLLATGIMSIKYLLETQMWAPLLGSVAMLVLVGLILVPFPCGPMWQWRLSANSIVYAWTAILALGPLLCFANDLRMTPEQIAGRTTKISSFYPLLSAVFTALGASTATLPISQARSISSIGIMLANSAMRHCYVSFVTGLCLINFQIWAIAATSSLVGFGGTTLLMQLRMNNNTKGTKL